VPVKSRPILFSAPMVRALLAGTKTQTRRVVKVQPHASHNPQHAEPRSAGWVWMAHDDRPTYSFATGDFRCPYGVPGDQLWVREQFAGSIAYERHGYPLREWGNKIWYCADGEPRSGQWTRPRPSIHMPRSLSRITLELTDVRVERLQDISEADALAEGVTPKWEPGCSGRLMEAIGGFSFRPAASAYADLWEQINGAGSWDANPWVWALSFKRV